MDKRILESSSETLPQKYYHPHSLILITDIENESVCDACIRTISLPYYTCTQSECKFVLHKFCAALPLKVRVFLNTSKFLLMSPRWNEFFTLFICNCCKRRCNGFGYSSDVTGSTVVDLECALAPKVIKHNSHKQHNLILLHVVLQPTSCCSQYHLFLSSYNCSVCNFNICARCAFLPKTVTHKFDKHPITLIFSSSSQHSHNSTDHFCEFCEEDIDPRYWYYHCEECDQSFHVNCIPSLGDYSKFKFGGTVQVPCHNDHPLTLVRMLNIGSQTCGYCHEIIEGFKDGAALHCEHCDYWIHFFCGKKSCGANVSTPMKLPLGTICHTADTGIRMDEA